MNIIEDEFTGSLTPFKRWYRRHPKLHHDRIQAHQRELAFEKWQGTKWESLYRKKFLNEQEPAEVK